MVPLDERPKWVERSKWGVLALAIGFFHHHVPFFEIEGVISTAAGIILVILGRKGFSGRHSSYVWVSIALWISALIIGIGYSVLAGPNELPTIIAYQKSAIQNAILAGAGAWILYATANVLLVWRMTKDNFRPLLGISLGAAIAIIIVATFFTLGFLSSHPATLDQASYDSFMEETSTLNLVVPLAFSLVFAITYVVVYFKIEIPKNTQWWPSPAVPYLPPPYPPTYRPP